MTCFVGLSSLIFRIYVLRSAHKPSVLCTIWGSSGMTFIGFYPLFRNIYLLSLSDRAEGLEEGSFAQIPFLLVLTFGDSLVLLSEQYIF